MHTVVSMDLNSANKTCAYLHICHQDTRLSYASQL